jgi:stage II sporulation protein D
MCRSRSRVASALPRTRGSMRLQAAVAALASAAVLAGCAGRKAPALPAPEPVPAPAPSSEPDIRVLLSALSGKSVLEVRAEGAAWIEPEPRGDAAAVPLPQPAVFRAAKAEVGVVLEGAGGQPRGLVRVRAGPVGCLLVGDRRYPGVLAISRSGAGLQAVNELDLETYLHGVVGAEMPASWEIEALKAQAVAARTYAVARRLDAGKAAPFDLRDDTRSQVYVGRPPAAQAARIEEATAATAGLILAVRGRPFTAYFHSTCGGHTESAERVFDTDRGLEPLGGVPCEFCRDSPAFRWEARLAKADVEAALELPAITSLRAEDPGPSGRCREVRMEAGDVSRTMSSMETRKRLGYGVVKSTAFTAEFEGEEILFRGTGFGHGVGMCQWGARGMAKAGKPFREILLHYYPGAEIVREGAAEGR